MESRLIDELISCLAGSRAEQRKKWAEQIVRQEIPLRSLFLLWHGETKTAQRFMWLIGDICELKVDLVREEMEFLFSIRNQFSFPGMDRSVAKWLWLTGTPESIELEAIEQLMEWVEHSKTAIACKSYSINALFFLASEGRIEKSRLLSPLSKETLHPNRAYAKRVSKQLSALFPELEEVENGRD